MNILRIGALARAALIRSGGAATPLAAFADAPYLDAGGEIIWVGARLPALHPRAVLTETAPARGVAVHFGALPAQAWSAQLPVLDAACIARVVDGALALARALAAADAPRGFGAVLAGREPAFPLDLAMPRVRALASAYARDDADAVIDASRALLGFGTGLTPSGDDLAGAALFGRRLVAPADARWPAACTELSHDIVARSHAISAALFRDLANGSSFAPLHETVDALAAGRSEAALSAARQLVAIGHSSGWDMLAGLVIGIAGDPG